LREGLDLKRNEKERSGWSLRGTGVARVVVATTGIGTLESWE
jgi:hypothetical protein